MKIEFVLAIASLAEADDYLGIQKNVASPVNFTVTTVEEALKELATSTVYRIYCDGVFVGYISYRMKTSDHIYIAELAIHSDFRGRGIGGKALAMQLIEAACRGASIASLVTHPQNDALRLYQRLGFVIIGYIDDYEGTGTPRHVLELKL